MIVIMDKQKNRVGAIKKAFKTRYLCKATQSAQELRQYLLGGKPTAVIADAATLGNQETAWESLLCIPKGTKLVLLADHYDRQTVESLQVQGIAVLPADTSPEAIEEVIAHAQNQKDKINLFKDRQKNMSRLRDHLFVNLLEGHDLPQDTASVMEFLGLTSPLHKYYLPIAISFAPEAGRSSLENMWDIAVRVQEICCEEIDKIAINRSCVRTTDRLAFVLLLKEPGDAFRMDLESTLEVIKRRVDKECGLRIAVGVGLADNIVDSIAVGYLQACDALDQGRFFGNDFVCFFCDLYERSSQRFQLSRNFKEQISQALFNQQWDEIDRLLKAQFHQIHTMGFANTDNILALKIDLAVYLMDLSDKLAVVSEKPKFHSQLINDFLMAGSLPTLETYFLQYLQEMVHASYAAHDKRAGRIVRNAQNVIAERMGEPINVQLLAQYLSISPNYLSAVFKAATGTRLTEYITNVKMQEAARLLMGTHKAVAEISEAVGYSNANYFSRLFKKQYNVNPSEYRYLNRETKLR